MTAFGMEIEISDVRTVASVQQLYKLWGRDFAGWKDRYGPLTKPDLDYSKWNAISEFVLLNSDGTRCMSSIIDRVTGRKKEVPNTLTSEGRSHWKGLEIISPVYANPEKMVMDTHKWVDTLEGATATARNWNATHFHFSTDEIPWEQLATWVPRLYEVQDLFSPLVTDWGRLAFFNREEVEWLKQTLREYSNDEIFGRHHWFQEYRTINTPGSAPKVVAADDMWCRRFIDVGPSFRYDRPNTIEFRCFTSSLDSNVTMLQLQIAQEVFTRLCDEQDLRPVEKLIGELLRRQTDV